MKGLLLKDFYVTTKFFRSYLLVIIVLTLTSVFVEEGSFFAIYLYTIAGMLPITLLTYDERSKWQEYCGTLPYGKAQIVSVKYVVGLISQFLSGAFALLIKAAASGFDGILPYLTLSLLGFLSACTISAVMLPFAFWLGVEKGRIVYYISMGAVCGCIFAVSDSLSSLLGDKFSVILVIVPLAAIALYAVSWCISISLYKKREVK